MLVGALMAFLMNSLSRKLKSTSRDALLEKIWPCAWVLGPAEPTGAAVITGVCLSIPPSLPTPSLLELLLCAHTRVEFTAGQCWLSQSQEGKGRPLWVCSASLGWFLSETTAGRGAGLPLRKEALSAAPLSVLGFSDLGKFGMVHQEMALGSTLKVSVASEDLIFLLGEGC